MSEMKPTPGPWDVVMYERGGFDIASRGGDGITICSRIPFRRLADEMHANARLIAEAGTVFHETGLSPRQLVEMNAELVEALTNFVDGCSTSVNAHEVARAALTKASASSISKGVE